MRESAAIPASRIACPPLPYDHAIEDAYPHEGKGILESLRNPQVRLARLGNARRMVAREDAGRRIVLYGGAYNLTRGDACAVLLPLTADGRRLLLAGQRPSTRRSARGVRERAVTDPELSVTLELGLAAIKPTAVPTGITTKLSSGGAE